MRGGIGVVERPVPMTMGSMRARERQAAALQAAERETGRKRTKLAAEFPFGYDQYSRYVNGITPIKVDLIELFAYVYGVDPQVLGHAILTGDTTAIPKWDIREALRARGETNEDQIETFAVTHEGKGIADQRAAVEDYLPDPATSKVRRHRSA